MHKRFLVAYLKANNFFDPHCRTKNLQSLHSDFIGDQICSGLRTQLLSRGYLYSILVRRLLGYNGVIVRNLPRYLTRILSPSRNFFYTPLSYWFCQLKAQLIKVIEDLYTRNHINVIYLETFFKGVLSAFSQISKLQIIDILAILNSFRKSKISFWMSSKEWSFSFSKETSITIGISNINLKIKYSIIEEIMLKLYNLLNPIDSYSREEGTVPDPRQTSNDSAQKDLICLMCLEVFRHGKFMIDPICSQGLQLSIDKPYEYWRKSLDWDKKRKDLLKDCAKRFIQQPYFSKKTSGWLLFVPESFCEFFIKLDKLLDKCQSNDDTLKSLNFHNLLF